MSAEKPRVLLIAVGGYGANYLKEMTERDTGAELAAVCDVAPDLYEKFPVLKEKRIPVFTCAEDFYKTDTADLAVISAPIQFHVPIAITCLQNGSNVLCEKPLCTTMQQAHDAEQAARSAGKFLALGYQMNYRRDVRKLKQDIMAGRYGAPQRLRTVHAMRRGARYYARNNWAGRITVHGSAVYDSPFTNACAHQFQLMTFLLGETMRGTAEIQGLEAEIYRANPKIENYDTAALRFTTPAGVPICYYTGHALREQRLGPDTLYEFENALIRYLPERDTFQAELPGGETVDYGCIDQGDRLQKLYDALACVQNGGAPICGVEAEYSHIRAVQLAQQAPCLSVDPAKLERFEEDGDQFCCIRELGPIFTACAGQYALPRELGYFLASR